MHEARGGRIILPGSFESHRVRHAGKTVTETFPNPTTLRKAQLRIRLEADHRSALIPITIRAGSGFR
jgi:hypothetical protein